MACGGFRTVNTSVTNVAWRVFVLGLGLGPAMPLLNLAVQNAVSRQDLGAVTANRQFFQQLGQALGGAIFGVVLATSLSSHLIASFAPIRNQASALLSSAIDPAAFRNVSVAEGSSTEKLDVGQQLAQRITISLEEQRQLILQARNDPQASQQLLGSILPELQYLVNDPTITDSAVNSAIDDLENTISAETQVLGPEVDQAVKQSYTSSITNIYKYSFALALIALVLVTFLLPEIPLAHSASYEQPVGSE